MGKLNGGVVHAPGGYFYSPYIPMYTYHLDQKIEEPPPKVPVKKFRSIDDPWEPSGEGENCQEGA